VKGFNQWRLGALRSHLIVQDVPDDAPPAVISNGTVISAASQNSAQSVMNGKLPGECI
jgi:hypothetical protein